MGSYIASATQNIELIVENILTSGKLATAESLRIGLIAYRDYPPQDNSYITKVSARAFRFARVRVFTRALTLGAHVSLSNSLQTCRKSSEISRR